MLKFIQRITDKYRTAVNEQIECLHILNYRYSVSSIKCKNNLSFSTTHFGFDAPVFSDVFPSKLNHKQINQIKSMLIHHQ